TLESPEDVFTIGLNRAVALLAEKKAKGGARSRRGALRKLGEHPQGGMVEVMSGRYGPYVKWGRVNATLREGQNPETISFPDAIAINDAKRKRAPAKKPARKAAAKRNGKVVPAEADA